VVEIKFGSHSVALIEMQRSQGEVCRGHDSLVAFCKLLADFNCILVVVCSHVDICVEFGVIGFSQIAIYHQTAQDLLP
jgi:hypothetical protein